MDERLEQEQKNDALSICHDYELFFAPESVDCESVTKMCEILSGCDSDPECNSITLWINNRGGDLTHGYALYDYIRSMRMPVVTKAHGFVGSSGVLIMLAGDKRIALPHTRFLIHRPYRVASEDDVLDHKNITETKKELEASYRRLERLLLNRCSADKADRSWKKELMTSWVLSEKTFSVQIALKMGLIHTISYPKKK